MFLLLTGQDPFANGLLRFVITDLVRVRGLVNVLIDFIVVNVIGALVLYVTLDVRVTFDAGTPVQTVEIVGQSTHDQRPQLTHVNVDLISLVETCRLQVAPKLANCTNLRNCRC